MKSELPQMLKKLRTKRGMSQEETAKIFNITQKAWSNYETGNREPSIQQLIDIAEYFDLPIDILVGRYKKSD